ncbi:MAG TPA: peroxiredoxin [Micrococcaceae bacterium]|jgi:peroxiredoxin Q/BCP|nr:peroxiredoxin [Micrococcaceae bacterium]
MANKLSEGTQAPDFTLPDADGNPVPLAGFAGKPVVVYFYPKAATPGCTTEACDFRDSLASLAGAGYAVVGISPDLPEALAAFRDDFGLSFPLLSDVGSDVARAWGAWGHKSVNGREFDGVLRSTVVLDGAGTVTHAEYNVAAEGHVARLRAELGVS